MFTILNSFSGVSKSGIYNKNHLDIDLDLNRFILDNWSKSYHSEFNILNYEKFIIKFYKAILKNLTPSSAYTLYYISLIESEDDIVQGKVFSYPKFCKLYHDEAPFQILPSVLEKAKPFLPIEFYLAEYLAGSRELIVEEKIKTFILDYLNSIYSSCVNHTQTITTIANIINDKFSIHSHKAPPPTVVLDMNNYKEGIDLIINSVPIQIKLFLNVIATNFETDILKILQTDIDNTLKYFPAEGLTLNSACGAFEYSTNEYLFNYIYSLYNISNIRKLQELSIWN